MAHEPVLNVAAGDPLSGTVRADGAKNSALKLLSAALLAPGRTTLTNVPEVSDVGIMVAVLEGMGVTARVAGDTVTLDVPEEIEPVAPYELTSKFRAGIIVLGSLLARCRSARVAMPGGDDLGSRKLDMHMRGLGEMGVALETHHGDLVAEAPDLHGASLTLEFPSVGATENLLLAAVGAKGVTEVDNAAREPEIADLCTMLTEMGATVEGIGTATLRVEGGHALRPVTHAVVGDRIECGTYLIAGAIGGGDVAVTDVRPEHLTLLLDKLAQAGCDVDTGDGSVRVRRHGPLRATDVVTLPYPGFATDFQPQMVALLSLAAGTSIVTENVYDARFQYVAELNRLGADVRAEGRHAVIRGVDHLEGAPVHAPDLRAGAALVCAGLVAEGVTRVTGVHHLERGYAHLVEKLRLLGADIEEQGGDAAPPP